MMTAFKPSRPFSPLVLPLLLLALLGGCATLESSSSEDTNYPRGQTHAGEGEERTTSSPPKSSRKPQEAQAKPEIKRPKPDAVYRLQDNRPLPPEAEQSLEGIAAQIKTNRNLTIRLESYVPGGGSREMNISRSSSAVHQVRRKLIELGVPSYRIQQATLGEEHPEAAQRDTQWVELFIVQLPR